MAIRKDYAKNMQFFLILIVCSVYQNTNASKKTIAKLSKTTTSFDCRMINNEMNKETDLHFG